MNKITNKLGSILELSFSLAKANFKLRNEGSYLGVFWYLLNPLVLFFMILFIRNEAFAATNIPNYPIYLLIGLLMHNFFIQLVGASISVIQLNGNFIKSIKIPLEALVVSRVLQSVFSHLLEVTLIFICVIYLNAPIEGIITYLAVFFLLSIFALGLSFIFATLGVYINDLNNVWIILGQLLFFITPIFHAPQVGSLLYNVNLWNPLNYFITAGREMLVYGRFPSVGSITVIVLISAITLFIGFWIFNKNKYTFAELV